MYPWHPLGSRFASVVRHVHHVRQMVGLDLLVIMALVALSRFMPHPPNMTAVLPFAVLSAQRYPRWVSCAAVLFLALVTDVFLGLFYGYPFVGAWTLYTYTGLMAVVMATHRLPEGWLKQLSVMASVSLGYWLWTNWGVWLNSDMYPKTMVGILATYANALPFLGYGLLGDLGCFLILKKLWQHLPWYVPCLVHYKPTRWSIHRHKH